MKQKTLFDLRTCYLFKKKKVTNYFKKMLLFFVLVCMSTSTCDVWFSSIRGVGDSAHSFVPALALALSFRWKLMLWRDNFILYLSLAWRDELCWLAPWAPILSNLVSNQPSLSFINHIIIIQNGLWLKVYTNWHLAANSVHQDLVNASLKHWKLYS